MIIPMLKTIEISKVASALPDYGGDPNQPAVILVAKGKPVAVVLPVHGADVETISVSVNPEFQEFMYRSRERSSKEGCISHEEMLKHFGLQRDDGRNAKPRKPRTKMKTRKSNGAVN